MKDDAVVYVVLGFDRQLLLEEAEYRRSRGNEVPDGFEDWVKATDSAPLNLVANNLSESMFDHDHRTFSYEVLDEAIRIYARSSA